MRSIAKPFELYRGKLTLKIFLLRFQGVVERLGKGAFEIAASAFARIVRHEFFEISRTCKSSRIARTSSARPIQSEMDAQSRVR